MKITPYDNGFVAIREDGVTCPLQLVPAGTNYWEPSPAQLALLALYGYEIYRIDRVNGQHKGAIVGVIKIGKKNPDQHRADLLLWGGASMESWMSEIAILEGRELTYNGFTIPDPP